MRFLAGAIVAAHLVVLPAIAAGGGSIAATAVPGSTIASAEFAGVACPSAKSCDAVGFYETRGNGYTLAERSAGKAWSAVSSAGPHPPSGSSASPAPVSAACTAVNYLVGKGGVFHTLVERSSEGGGPTCLRAERERRRCRRVERAPRCGSPAKGGRSAPPSASRPARPPRPPSRRARWLGSTWEIEKSPNPLRATNSQLAAVSCVTPRSCTAVGRTALGPAGSDFTLVEHWDGARWKIVPSRDPAGSTYSVLSGVSCPKSTHCEAVGYTISRGGRGAPLIERWNGRNWSIMASQACADAAELTSVACPAARSLPGVRFQDRPVPFGPRLRGALERDEVVDRPRCKRCGRRLERAGRHRLQQRLRLHRRRGGGEPRAGRALGRLEVGGDEDAGPSLRDCHLTPGRGVGRDV